MDVKTLEEWRKIGARSKVKDMQKKSSKRCLKMESNREEKERQAKNHLPEESDRGTGREKK